MSKLSNTLLSDNNDVLTNVGKKIVALRTFAGMTQSQLAARTGIPQSNISRIESGKYNPTIKSLRKIADGLEKHLFIDLI